jgi:gas vesicle protein
MQNEQGRSDSLHNTYGTQRQTPGALDNLPGSPATGGVDRQLNGVNYRADRPGGEQPYYPDTETGGGWLRPFLAGAGALLPLAALAVPGVRRQLATTWQQEGRVTRFAWLAGKGAVAGKLGAGADAIGDRIDAAQIARLKSQVQERQFQVREIEQQHEQIMKALKAIEAALVRLDKRRGGSGLRPLLFGALIGGGAALLYAPQPGNQTREKLRQTTDQVQGRATELTQKAKDGSLGAQAQGLVGQVKEQAAALKTQAQETLTQVQGRAQETLGQAKEQAQGLIGQVKSQGQETVDQARAGAQQPVAQAQAGAAQSQAQTKETAAQAQATASQAHGQAEDVGSWAKLQAEGLATQAKEHGQSAAAGAKTQAEGAAVEAKQGAQQAATQAQTNVQRAAPTPATITGAPGSGGTKAATGATAGAASTGTKPASTTGTGGSATTASGAAPAGKAAQIKEHMPVLDSSGNRIGTVDRVEAGGAIKLTKDAQGQHHWLPASWVARVDTHVHLSRSGQQVRQEWSKTAPKQG